MGGGSYEIVADPLALQATLSWAMASEGNPTFLAPLTHTAEDAEIWQNMANLGFLGGLDYYISGFASVNAYRSEFHDPVIFLGVLIFSGSKLLSFLIFLSFLAFRAFWAFLKMIGRDFVSTRPKSRATHRRAEWSPF